MPELEEELYALGAAVAWPATPQLRIVRTNWEIGETRPRLVRTNRRFALAAAAALLILAILLTYTPSRDVIAGWLNLHTNIQRVQHPPTPSAQAGRNLDLGTPTTLARAQTEVTWTVALPSSLGPPDAVYVKLPPSGPSGGEVTLVYTERPGIKLSGLTGVAVLVTEARGKVDETFFEKMLGPDATIEQIAVNGHAGYWISGSPHDIAFTDADGHFYSDSLRLATNTLLFDDNGTIVRIEGDLTKAQVVQICASMG